MRKSPEIGKNAATAVKSVVEERSQPAHSHRLFYYGRQILAMGAGTSNIFTVSAG
jgi:hypothetical protein